MTSNSQRPIDDVRKKVSKRLDPSRRSSLGQFMTPSPIADFMASLFVRWPRNTVLLDAGAGIGSLTEAFANRFAAKASRASHLAVHAYEIEPVLLEYLADHLRDLGAELEKEGHTFTSNVHKEDFIESASFEMDRLRFTHAILNPPYKKIGATSHHRKLLRQVGIETVNLYTAFLALAIEKTSEHGEVVAIVPRSFCNGTYFRPFREWLLKRVALTQIHIFESRTKAFSDDDVLQENIIIHLERGGDQTQVTVSTSHDAKFTDYVERSVPFSEIVKPGDRQQFIHIPTFVVDHSSKLFSHSLEELGLEVCTGPVVDFRVKDYWLSEHLGECAPLLYAHHFKGEKFEWPKKHKKPNALALNAETRKWLMPLGTYVITKRFSSKEERRRLVAYVVVPEQLPYQLIGFENHLNVIHRRKKGIAEDLAQGLNLFLNSTIVDEYFRNFSGHTQVNATDLRSMRFPSEAHLVRFGKWAINRGSLSQDEIDDFIESQNGI